MGSKKLGVNPVRSIPEPLDGVLLSDQYVSVGPNVWAGPGGITPTNRAIEGIVIKALAANTGTIYVTEQGKSGTAHGFPLAASESVSIGTDNLNKVHIWIPATGDGFAYLAIETVIK